MASRVSLPNGQFISRPDKEMLYYLCRFGRYPKYDKVEPDDLDRITDQDRQLANKLAARMGEGVWSPLIDKNISAIGRNWNLLTMTSGEWLYCATVTREVLDPLFITRIGVPRLTKALHRKRPNFIPVCDSILVEALKVGSDDKTTVVVECMKRVREVGQAIFSVLTDLRNLSIAKDMGMTELRILELLFWVVFGPFGTPQQRASYRPKCEALRSGGRCLLDAQQSPCV